MDDPRFAGLADDLAAFGDHLECMDPVQPSAGNVRAVRILIRQG
jgi:hypothetical protein